MATNVSNRIRVANQLGHLAANEIFDAIDEVAAGALSTADITATNTLTVGGVIDHNGASVSLISDDFQFSDGTLLMPLATAFDLVDNSASALRFRMAGGGNTICTVVTTNSAEAFNFTSRVTTNDNVEDGTARVVGGLAYSGVATSDTLLASAGAGAFVSFASTYEIPANTLKAGTTVRIRALVRVSNASGTDTLTCNLLLGSTSLIATTAVDPGATTDLHILEYELTSRAAPSASSAIVGSGRWATNTGGTIAHGTGLLGSTNFATNGALSIFCQAKWSATTANTQAILEQLRVDIV